VIILDTDIFDHLIREKAEVLLHREAAMKADPDVKIVLTMVTWCEAIRGRIDHFLKAEDAIGIQRAGDLLRRTLLQLDQFEVLLFDLEAVKKFGELQAKKKKPKGRADMLIACIALATGAVLATGNVKDYSMVAGLKIEDWLRSP